MPNGTLTKARIAQILTETNGHTRRHAAETIEILLEIIKRSLESGEEVLTSGFGKFCVKEKAQRRGRNLTTGLEIDSQRFDRAFEHSTDCMIHD